MIVSGTNRNRQMMASGPPKPRHFCTALVPGSFSRGKLLRRYHAICGWHRSWHRLNCHPSNGHPRLRPPTIQARNGLKRPPEIQPATRHRPCSEIPEYFAWFASRMGLSSRHGCPSPNSALPGS
jgi:hypothetical protein